MSEVVVAALITGVLSLTGVLARLVSRRVESGKAKLLQAELDEARAEIIQLHGESERYKAAYLGLLELTQGLLEEKVS